MNVSTPNVLQSVRLPLSMKFSSGIQYVIYCYKYAPQRNWQCSFPYLHLFNMLLNKIILLNLIVEILI